VKPFVLGLLLPVLGTCGDPPADVALAERAVAAQLHTVPEAAQFRGVRGDANGIIVCGAVSTGGAYQRFVALNIGVADYDVTLEQEGIVPKIPHYFDDAWAGTDCNK